MKQYLIEYKADDDTGWKVFTSFDCFSTSQSVALSLKKVKGIRAVRLLELIYGVSVANWGDQEIWRQE